MEGARALCIGGAAHYVVELVRVFARQVAKCEPGEFRCQGGVERVMRLMRLIGLRVHAVLQKNQASAIMARVRLRDRLNRERQCAGGSPVARHLIW